MNRRTSLAIVTTLGALGLIVPMAAGAHASAAPTITSISPTRGVVGQKVTIYGTNLKGVQVVQFNGTAATDAVANAGGTRIVADVPSETTTAPGVITVTTPGGTVTSGATFTVESAKGTVKPTKSTAAERPAIRSVTPLRARPGMKVTIKGANLRGTVSVKFAGAGAVYTVPSASRIVAVVPRTARSGLLTLATMLGRTSMLYHVAG